VEETMRLSATLTAVILAATPIVAHVSVLPRESTHSATETYTFRVPSEGGRTTTAVVLDVPASVTVVSVSAPQGATHAEVNTNGRIVQVTWAIDIQPGAAAQLQFTASNPNNGDAIAWKVHQKCVDGTVSDWTGEVGTRSPAPVTKLVASPAR
jgi:uncharacterized protein YcnI